MVHIRYRRTLLLLAAVCLLTSQTGCAKFLHNLKPHRLRMLNYNSSASSRDDVYFSVSDPLVPIPQSPEGTAVTGVPSR
ncbi:MAG: hypothetical protein ACKO2L_19820 [Planctomycetaceae bacterium]